jgi:hypothetical protein
MELIAFVSIRLALYERTSIERWQCDCEMLCVCACVCCFVVLCNERVSHCHIAYSRLDLHMNSYFLCGGVQACGQ